MRGILFFLIILTLGACTKKEFCITPKAAFVRMAFKTYNVDNNLVDTPLQNFTVYSILPDTTFAEDLESVLSADVFLSREITKQEFVILQSSRHDTISVFYKPELTFISNGCGYQTFFNIEDIQFSSQSIDSVNITNTFVNDAPQTPHLEVIYK